MAGNSQVLREYLLSLGFRINTTESKKFDTSINAVEKSANRAGLALVGVGTAAAAMAAIYVSQMEKLYYASRRTNTTVSQLQALGFAGKQIGLQGGQLEASLEGFSRSLRANPGLKAFLEGIVGPANGRSNAQLMIDMVKRLKTLPDAIGQQYASMFGIDQDTYFALTRYTEKLDDAMKLREKLNSDAGLDTEKIAQASMEWENQMRLISAHFEVMKGAMMQALLPAFKEVASVTTLVLQDWTQIFRLWKGFDDFKTRLWEGITGKATGGGVVLSDRSASRSGGRTPTGIIDLTSTFWKGAASQYKDFLARDPHMVTATPGGNQPMGIRNNNPGNLRIPGSKTGFQVFNSADEGLVALARQLVTYSNRGLNTIESIIKTYAPSSENDTKGYINDLVEKLGVDSNEKLVLNDPGTLSRLMQAIVQHENGKNPYALGSFDAASAAGISKGGFNQTNHFNIHGNNASEIAGAVGNKLTDVNGGLVRAAGSYQ